MKQFGITQNRALFSAKNQRNGFLVLWDCSRFDTYRTTKGKIVTAVTNLAEAARLRQRRYKVGPEPQPPMIQVLLKRAYALKRRLEENAGMTRAALAAEEGLDPSFLTRILNLLKLAPVIQSYILKMPPSDIQSPISERRIQSLARNPDRSHQISEFDKLKALSGRARIPSPRQSNHFFLNGNPTAFPIDIGSQDLPALKELN